MADSKHPLHLASKLEELRQQQSSTDVVMECAGGVVHAHKCVLLTSCPYFEKMFTVDMVEKNTGCVRFTGISRKVIEMIIKYLYVAEMPTLDVGDYDSLRDLLSTTRMMDLNDLHVDCWIQSSRDVNLETFVDLWAVAIDFGLEKEGLIEGFLQNNMKEISKYAYVQDLTKTQLTKLIECVDQKRFCSECFYCILKSRSTHDEAVVVQLLKKLDLRDLNNTYLHNLLQYVRKDKTEDTIENLLIEEAVARLLKFRQN